MYYPAQKVEQKYGQAPADTKKMETQTVASDTGVKYDKKDLLDKNRPSNGLLPKKNEKSKSRSKKIS
ncbi:MAG: hypothetical protein KGO92_01480, partial [Bacteroidota bacterium]|nr:hypothetical protein [Bacteroidota bacterium]